MRAGLVIVLEHGQFDRQQSGPASSGKWQAFQISDNALQKEQAARRLHMTFEAGVEITTSVIAWRGKVVFLNLMLTLSQCCVVIVMQIKLTVIVGEQRLSNL